MGMMMKRHQLRRAWLLCYLAALLMIAALHTGTFLHLNTEVLGDPSGDIFSYHVNVLTWVRQTLCAGHLPLWNHLIFYWENLYRNRLSVNMEFNCLKIRNGKFYTIWRSGFLSIFLEKPCLTNE
jgi:hypothetical protein